MTTIPNRNPGLAEGVTHENFKDFEAFLSDTPEPVTMAVKVVPVAEPAALALYSVVKFDSNGKVSGLADNISGANAAGARGILAMQVTPEDSDDAGAADVDASIYVAGHFNGDVLVWHDNFDDDAKREAAFRGAPTPSQIVVGHNPYHRKT